MLEPLKPTNRPIIKRLPLPKNDWEAHDKNTLSDNTDNTGSLKAVIVHGHWASPSPTLPQ